MKLSHKAITSFQKLYQDKCGVWLSDEEAQVRALEELNRFLLVFKSIPMKDLDLYNKFSSEISSN